MIYTYLGALIRTQIPNLNTVLPRGNQDVPPCQRHDIQESHDMLARIEHVGWWVDPFGIELRIRRCSGCHRGYRPVVLGDSAEGTARGEVVV